MGNLSKIKVFEGISKDSFEQIKNKGESFTLDRNKCLYTDRQKLNYVYFLITGKVTLLKQNESGDSRVIFILDEGDMINQPIMRNNTSAVECWGFEKSIIYRIEFSIFDDIMKNDYVLARNCMEYMEKRIRRLYRQLKNSVSINLDRKLAAKMYRLGLEYGIDDGKFDNFMLLDVGLSITFLSKMLGCQRESLSRAMKSLIQNKIVVYCEKSYYVNMEEAIKYFKQ